MCGLHVILQVAASGSDPNLHQSYGGGTSYTPLLVGLVEPPIWLCCGKLGTLSD